MNVGYNVFPLAFQLKYNRFESLLLHQPRKHYNYIKQCSLQLVRRQADLVQ
jgi:hypothetical protein